MPELNVSPRDDFYWSDEHEPHLGRRKEILKKYPEIRKLYGIDHSMKYKVTAMVLFQMISAPFIAELHWALFILISYVIGATITHSLFLAIHELSHSLAFKKKTYNNCLAIFANIPMIFPYAISFKTYHLLHHKDQGNEHTDMDLPSMQEARLFKGLIGKTTWALSQIFFYAIRPILVHPRKLEKWHIINIAFQIPVICLYTYFLGWNALLYLLISGIFAGSLHPLAGHFISEHYVFKEGQETYSYYGLLNKVSFNVGFHNEHHDFPQIPGSRLPKLKKMAGEYYDPLFAHRSWTKVLFQFITNKRLSLFSRIKRKRDKEN